MPILRGSQLNSYIQGKEVEASHRKRIKVLLGG